MNREQAREIAEKAYREWAEGDSVEFSSTVIADALHAAYEAERVRSDAGALHRRLLASEDNGNAARLASIKETARRMYASGQCGEVFDIIMNQAESFEDAFERRYGGGS